MRKILIFLSLLFFAGVLIAEEQQEPPDAWISYLDGKSGIIQDATGKSENLEQNIIIHAGDKIISKESFAEVEFGKENFLRVWKDSEVGFASLGEDVILEVRGDVYLQIENLDKELLVSFEGSKVNIIHPGVYRFRSDRKPEIQVSDGKLILQYLGDEKILEDKDIGVLKSTNIEMRESARQWKDDFDKFNDERMEEFEGESKYLDSEIKHYEPALNRHGKWINTPDHGYCWVPHQRYPVTGWRPYYWGHWKWYSQWGYTWIPYEPWGWVTYHYGSWYWDSAYGWYWRPGIYWRSAWVHWWYDGYYYGWAPYGWYSYWGRGNYHDYRGWNFVEKNQLQQRRVTVLSKKQLSRNVRISPAGVSKTLSVPNPGGVVSSNSPMGSKLKTVTNSTINRIDRFTQDNRTTDRLSRQKYYPSRLTVSSKSSSITPTKPGVKYYPQRSTSFSQSSRIVSNRNVRTRDTVVQQRTTDGYLSGRGRYYPPKVRTVSRKPSALVYRSYRGSPNMGRAPVRSMVPVSRGYVSRGYVSRGYSPRVSSGRSSGLVRKR